MVKKDYSSGGGDKKVRLKKDIVIPAGTVLENDGPTRVLHSKPPYEFTIALGKDHTGTFLIPDDEVELVDEYFESIQTGEFDALDS